MAFVKFPTGPSPHVEFPAVPPAPEGSEGGLIRHPSSFSIGLSDDGEPVSKHDRLKGNGRGPVSVPAGKAAPDTGGLPAEWLGKQASAGTVEHD